MSVIKVLIRWAVRIAFFFICMYPFNYGIHNAMLYVLITDLFCSCIALCRFSSDSITKVITGFGPTGDYGHYAYTDKGACRIIGWFFWLISFGCKLAMMYFCYLQLFKGGIPV